MLMVSPALKDVEAIGVCLHEQSAGRFPVPPSVKLALPELELSATEAVSAEGVVGLNRRVKSEDPPAGMLVEGGVPTLKSPALPPDTFKEPVRFTVDDVPFFIVKTTGALELPSVTLPKP